MGLLAVIALLLGLIIALLPEPVDRDEPVTYDAYDFSAPDAPHASTPPTDPPVERPPRPGADTETGADAAPSAVPQPPDGSGPEELWWLPAATVPPDLRGPLVLVLDDAGNSLDAYDRFLRFPGPMAVSVLPQLDYSVQAAALAAAAGKEIMLHQPMEALRGADPGLGSIGPADPSGTIAATIRENLRTVPGAIGVNNHMGSLATTDTRLMRTVLTTLHERGLFFLDSRTSADTVGRSVAAEVGIPFAERAVFLDNWRTRESILSALGHALELSQRGEPVVMIGHVTVPLLAEILLEVYPVLEAHGYRFVPVSRLVRPVNIAGGGEG